MHMRRAVLLNSSTYSKVRYTTQLCPSSLHVLQLLFYNTETVLKLNSTHHAGVAHRRAERPTNGLRFNSNGIMGNRITTGDYGNTAQQRKSAPFC